MKSLVSSVFLFVCIVAFGQNHYYLNFDGNDYTGNSWYDFYIDTVSNPNNIWQIGAPQKPNFNSAITPPNVIITDTINPYPINDTSSFIIEHMVSSGIVMPWEFSIRGNYAVDSDSLSDYGLIELSYDEGTTWYNVLELDTVLSQNTSSSGLPNLPVLTGNSDGWQYFHINLDGVFDEIGVGFQINLGETILIRFSFISDGIQTNKSGLMFDRLYIVDVPPIYIEKFEVLQPKLYPNPSRGMFSIVPNQQIPAEFDIFVIDNQGKTVKTFQKMNAQSEIDCADLPFGAYNLRLISPNVVMQSRIVLSE